MLMDRQLYQEEAKRVRATILAATERLPPAVPSAVRVATPALLARGPVAPPSQEALGLMGNSLVRRYVEFGRQRYP